MYWPHFSSCSLYLQNDILSPLESNKFLIRLEYVIFCVKCPLQILYALAKFKFHWHGHSWLIPTLSAYIKNPSSWFSAAPLKRNTSSVQQKPPTVVKVIRVECRCRSKTEAGDVIFGSETRRRLRRCSSARVMQLHFVTSPQQLHPTYQDSRRWFSRRQAQCIQNALRPLHICNRHVVVERHHDDAQSFSR